MRVRDPELGMAAATGLLGLHERGEAADAADRVTLPAEQDIDAVQHQIELVLR